MRIITLFLLLCIAQLAMSDIAYAINSQKNTSGSNLRSIGATDYKDRGSYVEVKAGVSKPRKLDDRQHHEHSIDYNIKNSNVLEVRGGYDFGSFAADLTLAHGMNYKLYKDDSDKVQTMDANFQHRTKAKYTSVILSGYYNLIKHRYITPYIGLGAGISRNTLNKTEVTSDMDYDNLTVTPGEFRHLKTRDGATTNNFAWQAMIGARAKVSQSLELSVEYKYTHLGKMLNSRAYVSNGESYLDKNEENSRFRINNLLVGMRYYF